MSAMTKEEKHSVMIDDVCGVLAWSRVLNSSTTLPLIHGDWWDQVT